MVVFGLGMESANYLKTQWTLGHVNTRPFIMERAAYVARYTQKKSLWPYKPQDGRAPEFATMSLKPGLGRGALLKVAATLKRHKPWQTDGFSGAIPLGNNTESLWSHGVPESIRQNGKIYPLGSYLINELAHLVGVPTSESAKWRLDTKTNEVRNMLPAGERLDAQILSEQKSQNLLKRQAMRKNL